MDGNNCPSCFIAMKNKLIRLEKGRERSSSLQSKMIWDCIVVSDVFVNKTHPIHSSNCTSDQVEINTEVFAPLKPRSYQECDFTSCEEKKKAQVCSLSLFWVSLLLILVLTGSYSLSLFWVKLQLYKQCLSLFWVNLLPILALGQQVDEKLTHKSALWDWPSMSKSEGILLDSGHFAAYKMDF